MCNFKTSWEREFLYFSELPDVLIKLKEMEDDGLLIINQDNIEVTLKGQPFIRNICIF